MSEEQQLGELRQSIDSVDKEIATLISKRAKLAQEVATVKNHYAEHGEQVVFYRPEREAQILRRIMDANQGPLSDEVVAGLFREIMSACLALEEPVSVAYLGPEGTFTQTAANKHFGHGVVTRPVATIEDIFREVEAGDCQYGLVPVENSTEGVITHTLDRFISSPLRICGEVMLRIHHHLLRQADDDQEVQGVFSHQQSLAQCRGWLDHHLPRAERIAVASNAEAARLAAESGKGMAAIAGESAAEIYGLTMVHTNIEDEPGNTTRFLIIGHQQVAPSGDDKTVLLLSTQNEAGALHQLLAPLADNNISMTRIESRPSRRGAWDYVFFVDVLGHAEDPHLAEALQALKARAAMFRVLGSFPNAVL
jgi:chorismate mutase/prephenate dehydratase